MTRTLEDRIPTIDLKTLRDAFKDLPDDTRIGFSGLTFHQPKWRGQTMINIEFNEHVHRDRNGTVVIEVLVPDH